MKHKITYLIITSALVMSAFLIGKSTAPKQIITKTAINSIQLEKAIPLSDVACWYVKDGYITVELKDVTRQLDDKANASYTDVLKDIPNETMTYRNNMIDISKITDFTATESKLQIYLEDGSGYYWERRSDNYVRKSKSNSQCIL